MRWWWLGWVALAGCPSNDDKTTTPTGTTGDTGTPTTDTETGLTPTGDTGTTPTTAFDATGAFSGTCTVDLPTTDTAVPGFTTLDIALDLVDAGGVISGTGTFAFQGDPGGPFDTVVAGLRTQGQVNLTFGYATGTGAVPGYLDATLAPDSSSLTGTMVLYPYGTGGQDTQFWPCLLTRP